MRPHGKYARVNARNPESFQQCDRCGFWRNASDLEWQYEWSGITLLNKQVLVCRDRCYDTPNENLRVIILPPDPPPVIYARVPNFAYEEQTIRITQRGGAPLTQFAKPASQPPWNAGPQRIRCLEGANASIPRIIQLNTSS